MLEARQVREAKSQEWDLVSSHPHGRRGAESQGRDSVSSHPQGEWRWGPTLAIGHSSFWAPGLPATSLSALPWSTCLYAPGVPHHNVAMRQLMHVVP